MRFAGGHCIISGLILTHHRPLSSANIGFFKTGSPITVPVMAPFMWDKTPTPTPTANANAHSEPDTNCDSASHANTKLNPDCTSASSTDSRGYCAASPKSATSAGVAEEPKFARMTFGICRPSQIS